MLQGGHNWLEPSAKDAFAVFEDHFDALLGGATQDSFFIANKDKTKMERCGMLQDWHSFAFHLFHTSCTKEVPKANFRGTGLLRRGVGHLREASTVRKNPKNALRSSFRILPMRPQHHEFALIQSTNTKEVPKANIRGACLL